MHDWRERCILYRFAAALHFGQTWPTPFFDRLVQAEAEEARQFRAEDLTHGQSHDLIEIQWVNDAVH